MILYLKTAWLVKAQMVPRTGSLHILISLPNLWNKGSLSVRLTITIAFNAQWGSTCYSSSHTHGLLALEFMDRHWDDGCLLIRVHWNCSQTLISPWNSAFMIYLWAFVIYFLIQLHCITIALMLQWKWPQCMTVINLGQGMGAGEEISHLSKSVIIDQLIIQQTDCLQSENIKEDELSLT